MNTFQYNLKTCKLKAMAILAFFLNISMGLVLASSAQAALSAQTEDAVKQFLDKHPSLEGRDYSLQ